jgi:two-component system, sensor histidine kinase ChiS
MEKAFRQRAAVALLFLLLVISSCQHADSPHVQKGSIDLSHYSFENNPSLALDGEWEFYRDTLMQPKTFHALNTQPVYLHVPGIWNKPGKGGHGTGTYRLRVKLDSTSGYLAIKTPTASSAYRLWINDSLISSNGIVSSTLAEVRPQYISKVCVFGKPKGQMDIVVQVANNFHANGGLWETVRLGSQDAIISRYNNAFIFQMFLVGAFIILSIYHL